MGDGLLPLPRRLVSISTIHRARVYEPLKPHDCTTRNKEEDTSTHHYDQPPNKAPSPTTTTSSRVPSMADSQIVPLGHRLGLRIDPCCIRCAQLYKSYPDLHCYPNYREDGPDKGLTRLEEFGCKNCRVRKLKCRPVPDQHHGELAALQSAAKLVHDLRERNRIPVAEFYELKKAQNIFSQICPVSTGRGAALRGSDVFTETEEKSEA